MTDTEKVRAWAEQISRGLEHPIINWELICSLSESIIQVAKQRSGATVFEQKLEQVI